MKNISIIVIAIQYRYFKKFIDEELNSLEECLVSFSKTLLSLEKRIKELTVFCKNNKSTKKSYAIKYIECYNELDSYIEKLDRQKNNDVIEDVVVYKDNIIFLVDNAYFRSISYLIHSYTFDDFTIKCIDRSENRNLGVTWNSFYEILGELVFIHSLRYKIDQLLTDRIFSDLANANNTLKIIKKYNYKFICEINEDKHYENKNLIPFGYTLANMKTGLFAEYVEAGKVLGLNEKQAKFFASTALELSRKEIISITNTDNNSLGALKKGVGKKLGFNNELQVYKDPLIKELAQKFENPAVLEAAKKVYQSSIRDKIAIAEEYAENKRIADMVRANPELLKMYEQMNQPEK